MGWSGVGAVTILVTKRRFWSCEEKGHRRKLLILWNEDSVTGVPKIEDVAQRNRCVKLPHIEQRREVADLFREGQGVVANGTLVSRDRFEADEVLAKHDETYMPPEVQDALEKAGHPGSKPGAKEEDAGYPKGDYD